MVPLHAANVWIYPNVPGTRKVWEGRPPYQLELDRGIAIYPADAAPLGPRLPLLGLSAVLRNRLDFWIDPVKRRVFLHTADWRTRLFRLLS